MYMCNQSHIIIYIAHTSLILKVIVLFSEVSIKSILCSCVSRNFYELIFILFLKIINLEYGLNLLQIVQVFREQIFVAYL